MLNKSRRLTRQTFPNDHREGFVVHSEHISLRINPKNAEKARFSAVISKKVASGSPERHTWKRRIYEIVAVFEKKTPLPPASYVFFAKRGSTRLSYKDLTTESEGLIRQGLKK